MILQTRAWIDLLDDILGRGHEVKPRGKRTLELDQKTIMIDTRQPVIKSPKRRINYRFMAAEAYWILSGDDTVKGIAPYNQNIAQFSDDGKVFFGAYGPKIIDQVGYVVRKLKDDRDSRQAGLTIWRENPPPTKDYPCTVAIFFRIFGEKLNCFTFMRSSDAWLGIPYDVFNLSMLTHYVCGLLNIEGIDLMPGTLYLTAASSHLYEPNWEPARECISEYGLCSTGDLTNPTHAAMWRSPEELLNILKDLRNTSIRDPLRWWETRYD